MSVKMTYSDSLWDKKGSIPLYQEKLVP